MSQTSEKPRVAATLKAAFGDAFHVVRLAPGITIVTITAMFAHYMFYETIKTWPEPGLEQSLLAVLNAIATYIVVSPLCVATYRWVLIDERPGFAALFGNRDVLISFIVVSITISLAVMAPLLFAQDIVRPEDAPGRFWGTFVAFAVLIALSIRLAFLQPAIATRSPQASIGASWRMTSGISWRLICTFTALIVIVLPIPFVIGFVELEGESLLLATAASETAVCMLLILPGSAVVARYYAWRTRSA